MLDHTSTPTAWMDSHVCTHDNDSDLLTPSPAPRTKPSGSVWITWHDRKGKWRVALLANSRMQILGHYADLSEAVAAHSTAARAIHRGFSHVSTRDVPDLPSDHPVWLVIRRIAAKCETKSVEVNRNQLSLLDLSKVDGAIADVERRVSLVSAPRPDYLNARSDAIARGLMGETVDPSDLQRSTEFADALPAGELAEGLRALKSRRDELNRRMIASRGDARRLQSEYFIAHAEEHGARYLILREQIAQSYIQLLAAQRSALNLTSMSMLVPLHFENFNLPSPDKTDDLKSLRTKPWLPGNDIDGNMLARSALVGNATVAIRQEMGV